MEEQKESSGADTAAEVYSAPPSQISQEEIAGLRIPFGKRLLRAVALLILCVAIPFAVGLLFGHRDAAIACVYGTIIVIGSASFNGLRATRYAAPAAIVAIVLGAITKPVADHPGDTPFNGWLWVAVVVFFAMLSGFATRRGAGVAMSMATLFAVVAPAFRDYSELAEVLIFLAIGSVYGWLIASRIGAPTASPAPPTSPRSARLIAIFLGIAVGLGCSVVVVSNLPHATWIATAVVVLGIPTPGFTEKAILWRMVGQLLACGIVAVVTWIITSAGFANPLPYFGIAVGLSLLCYLMSLGSNVAVQIAFLSTTLMLPVAAKESSEIGGVVIDRIAYNLIGLGILALALVAVRLWAREIATSTLPPAT